MCHEVFNNILLLFYFTFERGEILFVTRLISSTNSIMFVLSVAIFLFLINRMNIDKFMNI